MKQILKFTLAFMAGAIATISCNKAEEDHDSTEGRYYTFTIADDLTKATLDNTGVKWEDGDRVGMYIVDADGTKVYTGYAKVDVTTTPKTVILYSKKTIPANAKAYAYYPYDSANDDKTETVISFGTTQEGGAASAMPLAGIPFTVETEVPYDTEDEKAETNGEIHFLNLGALIDFRVFAAAYSNETVQYVKFQAETKQGSEQPAVTGPATLDLTGINLQDASCLNVAFQADAASDYAKVNQQVPVAAAQGDASPIYMVVAPGTYSGTITIGTDAATYTFPFTNKVLPRSTVKHYLMDLSHATRVAGVEETVMDLPYSETFTANKGEFTIEGGTGNEWTFGQYGATVTGFYQDPGASQKSNHAVNTALVSPWINLADVVNAQISFSHNRNGYLNDSDVDILLQTYGENAWTSLEIALPAKPSKQGSYSGFQDVVIPLESYMGGKVRIKFTYTSTTSNAGTYEVKNFSATMIQGHADIAYAEADQSQTAFVNQSSFTAPALINPHNLTVTYASDNADIASVNATSGAVTIGSTVGTATITATFDGNDDYEAGEASYSIKVTDPNATSFTDILTKAVIGVNGTSYTDWSGIQSYSSAVYAGNCAGGNNAIQLKSSGSTSGIVTTASGGYAKKITVTWNSNTASDRILAVYGKNTPYERADSLYKAKSQGTLLGHIAKYESTELVISGNYQYLGLRSKDGAMYIDKIEILWSTTLNPTIHIDNLPTQHISADGATVTFDYTIDNPVQGKSVSASADQTWVNSFSYTDNTISFQVDPKTTSGIRQADITVSYDGAESQTFRITQDGANSGGGQTAFSTTYTSNIELSTTGGTSASSCKVQIGESQFDGLKAGTSGAAGAVKIKVPIYTKTLHFHIAAWNKESVTVSVTPEGYSDDIPLTANSGISGNSPFTFSGDPSTSDYYKTITFAEPLGSETELTFTATEGKRFVIWGVNCAADLGDGLISSISAGSVGTAGATLTASFVGVNISPAPQEAGFRIGTSPTALNSTVYTQDPLNAASGSFSASVSSLTASTTYYYQAFMTVWDGTSAYTEIMSEVGTFTTLAPGQLASNGYLNCYEIPAINYTGTGTSGNETFGSTKWYSYETTSSTQKAVTHTYYYDNKVHRNYTTFMDKTKKAPLWVAFVMQGDIYKDNNAGRYDKWTSDPAFSSDWQQCSADGGYSRGHFVASNYRQNSTNANQETFYYTNQALQWQNGFNGGIWNSLELAVNSHMPTGRDTLYVVVGTLYKNSSTSSDDIPIPSHFYKLLMKCSFSATGAMTGASGCAYLFTNESHSGSYSSFIKSIDYIEEETGFDFFPNVPDSFETAAEASTTPLW